MTQASATGRVPRGWDRLVATLNAAPDLPTFHRDMLDLQGKIVAAEYGALWALDGEGKPRALEAWPQRLAEVQSDSPMMKVLAEAAASGFQRGSSHVLKAEPEDASDSGNLGAHIFVTVLRVKGQPTAVSTVVAECRDVQVLQSTAPLRELAAGLYEGFFARLDAKRQEVSAQRLRQAVAVLAVSQEAPGFYGACLNLVNELARQLQCSRVSLGWVRGPLVRVQAMSDTENLKRHSEQVASVEMAMAECLDQEQPIVYPVAEDAEPLLRHAVVHSHRRLTGGQAGRHAMTLPLRRDDEIVGVLLLERADHPFDSEVVQFLQLVVDVVTPHLYDRKQGSRLLIVHAWHAVEKAAAYVVGPRHTIWKLGAIAALVAVGYVIFGTWDYRVSAQAVLEAGAKRIVPAPFEGLLQDVHVRPGQEVKAGAPLARLDTRELELQLAEAKYERNRAALAREQAMAEGKIAESMQAQAQIDQVAARIRLLEFRVSRAVIKSPIDGVVMEDDWNDRIGGVVKQGDPMFHVAPLQGLTVVVRVDERDIDQVRSAPWPYAGHLATKSEPEKALRFAADRLVPLAQPVNGVNCFELHANLDLHRWSPDADYLPGDIVLHDGQRYRALTESGPSVSASRPPPDADPAAWDSADWIRPGMEGLAKIQVGPRPLYWVLSHRIVDTVRLWLWW